jgi:hypothetical protein
MKTTMRLSAARCAGRRGGRIAALALSLALAACGSPPEPASGPAADGWYEFQGSWIAAGRRQTLALGGDRRASIVDLTGSMLLSGPGRPGAGFRAEVVGLGDTATGFTGRAVWTDEAGDRVYSELRGQGTATGSRIDGTFVGGTGRYVGATGTYELSWQYVLEAEDGTVQGRAVGLKGRVHVGAPAVAAPPSPPAGGTKP